MTRRPPPANRTETGLVEDSPDRPYARDEALSFRQQIGEMSPIQAGVRRGREVDDQAPVASGPVDGLAPTVAMDEPAARRRAADGPPPAGTEPAGLTRTGGSCSFQVHTAIKNLVQE